MFSKFQSYVFPFSLSVLFVGMSTTGAHAYLDAGTGSMILQLLLGGIAGIAIAAKLYWYRLLSLFGVKSKTDRAAEAKARVPASHTQADR